MKSGNSERKGRRLTTLVAGLLAVALFWPALPVKAQEFETSDGTTSYPFNSGSTWKDLEPTFDIQGADLSVLLSGHIFMSDVDEVGIVTVEPAQNYPILRFTWNPANDGDANAVTIAEILGDGTSSGQEFSIQIGFMGEAPTASGAFQFTITGDVDLESGDGEERGVFDVIGAEHDGNIQKPMVTVEGNVKARSVFVRDHGELVVKGDVDSDVLRITDSAAAAFQGDVTADRDLEIHHDALGWFAGNVTAESIVLQDSSSAPAIIGFGGNPPAWWWYDNGSIEPFSSAPAQTVRGAIDGDEDGHGWLVVRDATDITFEDAIGESGYIQSIEIDDSTARFEGAVHGGDLLVFGSDSDVTFSDTVVAAHDVIVIQNATATFEGDVQALGTERPDDPGDNGFFFGPDPGSVGVMSGSTAEFLGDVTAAWGTGAMDGGTVVYHGNAAAGEIIGVMGGSTATFHGSAISDGLMGALFDSRATFLGTVSAEHILIDPTSHIAIGGNTVTADQFNNMGTLEITDRVTLGPDTILDLSADAITVTIDGVLGETTILASPEGASLLLHARNGDQVFVNDYGGTVNLTNDLTIQFLADFQSGTVELVDDVGGGTLIDNIDNVSIVSTGLTTYAIHHDGTMVEITAETARSIAQIAAELGITISAATALVTSVDAAETSDPEALAALTDVLARWGAAARYAAWQTLGDPTAGGAASRTMSSVGAGAFRELGMRLASFRDGTMYADAGNSGFAASDLGKGRSVWLKPFASQGDQGERHLVPGYDYTAFGLLGGIDQVFDRATFGLSLGYTSTDVDGKGPARNEFDITSFQAALYGDYHVDSWYLEGMLGYARNRVDTRRIVDFSGLNRIALGDYDADQYMLRMTAGMPLARGEHVFTPKAGFQYIRVNNETYVETGAGGLSQVVTPDNMDFLLVTAGMDYHTEIHYSDGSWRPSLRTGLFYDLAGDKGTATVQFTGGGPAFRTEGASVARFGGTLGAGMTYTSGDGIWDLSFDYDLEARSSYFGHMGSIQFRYRF